MCSHQATEKLCVLTKLQRNYVFLPGYRETMCVLLIAIEKLCAFLLSYRGTVCVFTKLQRNCVYLQSYRETLGSHQATKKLCVFSPSYKENMFVLSKL